MLQKVSPEPMENSSGYISNTNSMNPTAVKYATVGRSRPGGVKRTSSLVVSQPVVPPTVYKAPPRQRDVRKHYKNNLSRPSSQASRSSGGSGARRPSSRNSREAASERLSRQRAGSSRRSSHSKVRRPESRTSSKALILRRRESNGHAAPQRSASIRSGREARDARPDSRGSQASQRPVGKPPRSIFASWKPRITLRRSKSLQVKPEPVKKREIRFGDEYEPSVIMMKGVEHRRIDAGAKPLSERTESQLSSRPAKSPSLRLTQTLNRPAKRASPPSRSQRASSAEATRRLEPVGEAPQEGSPRARRYRPHEKAARPPSELSSSSPRPRAPVWRADSDGSLSDTMTARSRGSTVRSARHGDKYVARAQRSRARTSESTGERKNTGVMGFLRRTFSVKPRDKLPPAPVKKRERASSSSLSSLERPARHSKLKTAKSHEVLTVEPRDERDELVDERNTYRSLPRSKHKTGGTTLSRRLSSLGWATVGRPAERSRSFREEPRNNERFDLNYPPIPPKATNEATRGRPRHAFEEDPIRPIIQERRALSQPSLYQPPDEREPPQEPFTHYANLPFQLAARHRSSPDLTEPLSAAPAKRAASQPSLLARGGRRSSGSSSSLYSPDERPRSPRDRANRKPAGAHRKGILKRQKSSERRLDRDDDGVKNVNVARDVTKHGRQRQHGVLQGLAHNIKNVFRHRKSGEKQAQEGRGTVPGGDSVVSERYVNVTNTHEERESGREEEEIHHLGNVSNEELTRAIRDGVDARQLVQRQVSAERPGQLADPRAPQRRLLHQHGRTWRTVDTDDLHETSRHDRRGELVTESAHSHQREEFHNVQVPDDGSDEDAREQVRSSSHSRRHTKDVDMLEHFSVPKGGRLADGIKLGDGLRYVQENIEEERRGDADMGGVSERVRDMHRLGFRPPGQTSTPIEYRPEEKTKRKQTNNWLTNHFGSESGHSRSSEDEGRPRSAKKGRDETDRRRETSTYEFQKSSGTTQRGTAPAESWQRSEKYTREVRETPERTYIKETRESPRGGFERLQVLPAGSPRPATSSAVSDMTSEVDEDPIFASKFSSGKPRSGGGLMFGTVHREDSERRTRPAPLSPPTSPLAAAPPPPPSPPSPPAPSAPPRTKRKNRLKQQAPVPPPPPPPPVERPEPARPFEFRREVRQTPPRQLASAERDTTPVRVETTQHEDGRVVKEYHFRSSESPRGDTPARATRRGSSSARESPPRPAPFGQRDRSHSTDEPDSARPGRHTSTLTTRLGGRRHHQSSDELDRRTAEPPFSTQTVDRRRPARDEKNAVFQTQTLPRKPREARDPPAISRLSGASRFGGSMINVSVRNNVLGNTPAPRKPARSPVRRSNSLYGKDGQPATGGLKSPDIISAIQRTASVRRDEPPVDYRRTAEPPVDYRRTDEPPVDYRRTDEPPVDYRRTVQPPVDYRRTDDEVVRRNTENAARSGSQEPEQRSTVIPVSVEPPRQPPAKVPPKVAPKVAPKPRPVAKENFMRGLMQTAPELYSALHGDERKDSKTPSPKQSPPLTPPPPLHRARSPASPAPMPLDYGVIYPKTPPVFKRIERLRADEEVVTKEGRSRSATPAEDVHNFRLGTMSPTGERTDVIKVQR